MAITDRTIWLFSYGTLQQENVQLATFGRRLEGRPDRLPGYAVQPVTIELGPWLSDPPIPGRASP